MLTSCVCLSNCFPRWSYDDISTRIHNVNLMTYLILIRQTFNFQLIATYVRYLYISHFIKAFAGLICYFAYNFYNLCIIFCVYNFYNFILNTRQKFINVVPVTKLTAIKSSTFDKIVINISMKLNNCRALRYFRINFANSLH